MCLRLYIHFSPLFLRQDEKDIANQLIVIQCDSGHKNGNLIACARYRIYDERIKAINKNKVQNRIGVTHVLFIINLPHQIFPSSSFVGFQGDPWISYHIDDLRPTSGNTIEPQQAILANISELFIGGYISDILPFLGTVHEPASQQMSPASKIQLAEEEREENMEESDTHSLSNKSDRGGLENAQKPTLERAELAKLSGVMEVVDVEKTQEMEFATADRQGDQEADTDDLATQILPDRINMHLYDEYSEVDSENSPGAQIPPTETITLVRPEEDSVSLSEVPKQKRVTIDQYPIAQCQRLYGCIQAAASRLEDATNLKMKDRSTQRVSRLTKLIPQDPVKHIGKLFSSQGFHCRGVARDVPLIKQFAFCPPKSTEIPLLGYLCCINVFYLLLQSLPVSMAYW